MSPIPFQAAAVRVYLVGAGPGDPGLITLRGVEVLRQADVVFYDYLVNPRILQHVRPQAEKVCLGRHGGERLWPQAEINARVVAAAQQGRTVVRLKSGDPLIFGRAGEETAALTAAQIPFEIVPGITAALACGAYAGVPLTHRDYASAVALITGQEGEQKPDVQLDYAALARFPGTLVFYMGVTTAKHWSAALIAAGKSAATPAVIVRRCAWPDQTAYHCTLATVAEQIAAQRIRPPVLVIVGEVAGLAPVTSWFMERPLFGQRVLVTRPSEQSAALSELLLANGADCLLQPAIQIGPAPDEQAVTAVIERLPEFDWIVFSSANGVTSFLDRVLANRDLRALGAAKLAVIGPGTAAALAEYRLRADLQPAEFRAEALAESLAQATAGKRCLLIRASRGREVLAEQLTAAGASVEQVVTYASIDVTQPDPDIAAQLAAGKIDWVTVTSSAIARSLAKLFGSALSRAKLASISPITSATLRELGLEPAVEATEYTMPGVVQAIVRACETVPSPA